MPEISNPQIVTFANERCRTLADQIERLHYAMTAWQADYAAQGIAAQITAAGASNLIADGSAQDGRARITGTQIINMKAAVDQLATALGTTLVSGVGATVKAIVDGIQVNGSPR